MTHAIRSTTRDNRVQELEPRRLLAVGIDDRVLVVEGTSASDSISITAGGGGGDVSIRLNNVTSTFNGDDFDGIVVNGLGGDDTVDTDAGSEQTLLGGDGDDSLYLGSPERPTSVSGGAGTDLINLGDGEGTTVDLRLYPDVENARLLFSGQSAIGNDLDNHLAVYASPIDDVTMAGGDGNDTLIGWQGNDVLSGDAGDDSLVGWAGDDTLDGDAGDDFLHGSTGDDSLDGGDGGDTLFGDDGGDDLDGGAGTDTLFGGRGNDALLNGEVTSLLRLEDGILRFDGTSINDEVFVSADGSDLVASVEGEEETFDLGDVTGIVLSGGDGDDLLELDASLSIPATLDGGNRGDTLTGGAGDDRLTDSGLEGGRNVLTGNGGDDLLVGDVGRGTLHGGDGDDTLDGGLGPDVIHGDAGRDTLDYSSRTKPLHVVLDGFEDDGEIGEVGEGDLAADDIEIVLGGSGHDLLGGTGADNEIHGMGGYDTISGGGGDDALFGWHGNDVILGGDGDDYVEAGAGHDNVQGNAGRDTILALAGNDALFGWHGDDVIFGGDGDDYVEAGAGHDRVYGNAGRDTILALAGNDRLFAADDGNDDLVLGGRGTDVATVDDEDDVTSVETVL